MFSHDSLLNRRKLEDFLNSEDKPFNEEKTPKDNFIIKTIEYFTGKSNVWYTYVFDEVRNDITYNFPRTFVGDVKNIKNYLTNLFSKKK